MNFGRARALRLLARRPMSMGELAAALGIDPDDLEALRRILGSVAQRDAR